MKKQKFKTREYWLSEKFKLETQISNNQGDPVALAALRDDYRKVCDKVEMFYDDVKEGVTNE